MSSTSTSTLPHAIARESHPLVRGATDYRPLLDLSGDTRFVLPGEVSNDTHEFYRKRAEITKRLIASGRVSAVAARRLERAIGVNYRPENERASHYHYFYARLPEQFDAVLHFDETHAVRPLERTSGWLDPDLPETYPFRV